MEDDLAEVVARNARRLRGDRTQDAVANLTRTAGLDWSRAIVAAVETGQRRLDLREAALFATALGAQVSDLVAGSKWERMYTRPYRRSDGAGGGDNIVDGPQPVPRIVAAASNEAERRAAAKLGVDLAQVNAAAFRLWGRSLTDERDARAARRAGPTADREGVTHELAAIRGRVTRELLDELRTALKKDR